MALQPLCWLAIVACGIHIVEEYLLDWPGWVASISGVSISTGFFLGMNGLVMLLGIACATVANTLPGVGLAIPALMLINATFFHVGAVLWTRGRFSPGLITAVTLFYPIGILCFKSAYDARLLTVANLIVAFALGGTVMIAPLTLLAAGRLKRAHRG